MAFIIESIQTVLQRDSMWSMATINLPRVDHRTGICASNPPKRCIPVYAGKARV
jgi:hypothetical protein